MYEYFIGIDPGSSGTITVITKEGKIVKSVKMPETILDAWRTLEEYKKEEFFGKIFGLTEKVWAYPGNGAVGAFTFGYNVCIADTILFYNNIPFEKVAPHKWMSYFGITRNKEESDTEWKGRLYTKAQQLFPQDKFYKYQADSILLAEYCRRIKLENIY